MTLPRTPSLRLDGRRALISGGTRGIGLGAATVLAEAGAAVTIAARTAADIEAAVAALETRGLDAHGATLDVTDTAAVADFLTAQPPLRETAKGLAFRMAGPHTSCRSSRASTTRREE